MYTRYFVSLCWVVCAVCGPQPLDRDAEHTQVASASHRLSSETEREEALQDTIQKVIRHDSSFVSVFQTEEAENKSEEGKIKFTSLPHITDLSTYMIQNVISFAKIIQTFRYTITFRSEILFQKIFDGIFQFSLCFDIQQRHKNLWLRVQGSTVYSLEQKIKSCWCLKKHDCLLDDLCIY